MTGARRGRGMGEIGRVLECKDSAQEREGSTCSKPIVWFVFHNHFPIVKITIGQN